MRNITSILLAILMTTIAFSCSKNSDDPVDPPVDDKYSVNYKLELTGEYTDFKLVYFEAGSVKKEITSIVSPWEKTFDNFAVGDSAVMYFSYTTVVDQPTSYQTSADVFKNGNSIAGQGVDLTVTGFNPPSSQTNIVPVISYKFSE